ncbi:SUKH-3 domain-containing protein [Clostridium diolis]|uniref:SUKH-3 domain-containing protein n=1 Tax=Clostridium diolis TaxID=223919 RepID=UPI003AF8BC3F
MFEANVKEILVRAGWFENRKIDITDYVKILESAGYEVFDAVRKFLEEFGELNIIPKYIDSFGEEDYEEHSTCLEDINYLCKYNTNYDEEDKGTVYYFGKKIADSLKDFLIKIDLETNYYMKK